MQRVLRIVPLRFTKNYNYYEQKGSLEKAVLQMVL